LTPKDRSHVPEKLPRWRITRIRATPAVDIGTVEARDAEQAIQEAIKVFGITNPEQQKAACGASDRMSRSRAASSVLASPTPVA
jgi:hypothetical protein